MMRGRFHVVTWNGGGNTTPAYALARRLVARGHEVTLLGQSAQAGAARGCAVYVPCMWGYGGDFVVLLPNGVSAFRFADGNPHDLETMILAGEAIRPLCTSTPAAAPTTAVSSAPLSAAELQAQLPGNTFSTGGLRVFIAPGGCSTWPSVCASTSGGGGSRPMASTACRAWTAADDGRERCHQVYRNGETFTFHVHDRWTVFRWTRTSGRPADL
jgi:hypothetical protein